MAQVGNTEDRLGGEFMIQDRDHMSDSGQAKDKTSRNSGRQSEQSQGASRQQGANDKSAGRQRGEGRRQNH